MALHNPHTDVGAEHTKQKGRVTPGDDLKKRPMITEKPNKEWRDTMVVRRKEG